MILRRLVVVVFAVCVAALSSALAAGPIFPPGSRVGLEPAGDLRLSQRFPGFEDPDRHVAVVIFDLPAAAYDQLSRSAFNANQQGMTGLTRENFSFANGVGVLVSAQAQENGAVGYRWFLVAAAAPAAAADLAMLIRVEVPETARSVYSDAAVRQMLASVSFRTVPTEELLGLLPFKLSDLAGLRVMKVVPDGVIAIDGPGDDMSKQPYAIVTIGRGAPDNADDRNRFARDLLTTAPLRDLQVTSVDAMRIGGWPGIEIRGQGNGLKGEPVKLVQWVRFGGANGFLRIVAVAGKDQWDAMFNRFRALRDGVDLR